MQIATTNSFLATDLVSFAKSGDRSHLLFSGELYQEIIARLAKGLYKREAIINLGDRLITIARQALNSRQMDVIAQASKFLTDTSLPQSYQNIGYYYQAFCLKRQGEFQSARMLLEQVAESSATPLQYRARALQTIGGVFHDSGNLKEGSRFFLQAAHTASPRYANDLQTFTMAQWMIAVIRSIQGDNKGALADLEKLFPFVRFLAYERPFIYYSYANSLAVELTEVGRLEEARRASEIAIASPYASACPEWRETRNEIAQKSRRASRSVVSLSCEGSHWTGISKQSPTLSETAGTIKNKDSEASNLVRLPEQILDSGAEPLAPGSPARVIPFMMKMASKPEKNTLDKSNESARQQELADKRYEILKALVDDYYMESDLVEELYEVLRKREKKA